MNARQTEAWKCGKDLRCGATIVATTKGNQKVAADSQAHEHLARFAGREGFSMTEFDNLKAQKDAILRKDCGEDKFALAVRVLARLREAGLIQINGKTDEEWRDNLHKAQILTMQVINATHVEGKQNP